MRKFTLLVLLVICALLFLSACQVGQGRAVETPLPTETPIPIIDDEQIVEEPVKVNTQMVSPTLAVNEEKPLNEAEFDCTETFCLWPWKGWMERPIGLGGVRTIDPSYPYASTGGGTLDLHHGVEFLNPYGTPVLAAQDGEVVFADFDADAGFGPYWGFYGEVVILRHPNLKVANQVVYTLYAHLSTVSVAVGDQVRAGDMLGKVGYSGAAIGPHLHFEVRVELNDYDHTVNPVLWFAPLDDPDHPSTATLAGIILGLDSSPLTEFQLTLERLTEFGTVEAYYYPKTYEAGQVNTHPLLGENFAIVDLPPGDYRLAFSANRLYEVIFTLEPGALGFIKVQLD
jgi:murein DD-endopeptidase MepM/ murein hydrolase activator NlpD